MTKSKKQNNKSSFKISKSSQQKSDLTCPDGIIIKPSTISKAGKGVFATKHFEKNTFFGPYTGTRHSNFKSAQESGYAWSIADKNGKVLLIEICFTKINSSFCFFSRWFILLMDVIQIIVIGCDM